MEFEKKSATVWQIRRGMDRRFRAGHPWVYSNELAQSPKGITPGEVVELRDASGKFLARGFGNPNSLIAFRALSRNPSVVSPMSQESILKVLKSARALRRSVGLHSVSHRLCFGESDGIPGLIIDRYFLASGQVFVVQPQTAGADQWVPRVLEDLEAFVLQESREFSESSKFSWEKTSVVLRTDVSVRQLEGVPVGGPTVLRDVSGEDLRHASIRVASVVGGDPLAFEVDLVEGQKTGFFLDQFANIQVAALRFENLLESSGSRKIRILDLCCYVGQWSAQLARVFRQKGIQVEVVAADVSASALEFAKKNIEAEGASCSIWKTDVLKTLGELDPASFDLVIADPPALIKSRKDIPKGSHAYLQLMTGAFRAVKDQGGIIACSCSALLEESSFTQILAKAAQRNQAFIRWMGRGIQSPDHPILAEFSEAKYLKCWIGLNGI